jgi:dihydrodipicolinate synthase/N-acetylneuraminate lyase
MPEPTGLWTGTTPTDLTGAIDDDVLVRNAERLFNGRCDGLVLFGSRGEDQFFSISEWPSVAEGILTAGIAPERLALGAGSPAVANTLTPTRRMLGVEHHPCAVAAAVLLFRLDRYGRAMVRWCPE